MVGEVLTNRLTAETIARRAGVRTFASAGARAEVLQTFSSTNDPSGWVFSLSGGTDSFPDGPIAVLADVSDKTEERLLANVATAGPSGSALSAGTVSVPIDAEGIIVSDWTPIQSDAVAWHASSPTPGPATVGLIQRQAR